MWSSRPAFGDGREKKQCQVNKFVALVVHEGGRLQNQCIVHCPEHYVRREVKLVLKNRIKKTPRWNVVRCRRLKCCEVSETEMLWGVGDWNVVRCPRLKCCEVLETEMLWGVGNFFEPCKILDFFKNYLINNSEIMFFCLTKSGNSKF